MSSLYRFINKIFPETYPKYQVCTDELGEQPILSPEDWKVLMASEPQKAQSKNKLKKVEEAMMI